MYKIVLLSNGYYQVQLWAKNQTKLFNSVSCKRKFDAIGLIYVLQNHLESNKKLNYKLSGEGDNIKLVLFALNGMPIIEPINTTENVLPTLLHSLEINLPAQNIIDLSDRRIINV